MNMQPHTSLGKSIAIFIGLAVVFAVMIVAAGSVTNVLEQLVLVSVGSAIFSSGLTFFLIRATSHEQSR